MIGNFTNRRKRMFMWQMFVWTLGVFIVIPAASLIFPYLIDMPLEKYGVTPGEMLPGLVIFISILWFVGVLSAFLAHLLNPLTIDDDENCKSNTDEIQVDSADISVSKIIATITGMAFYCYMAFGLTLVLFNAVSWLGLLTGILFIVFGIIAFRQHINGMFRRNRGSDSDQDKKQDT
jgi:hypothetical protein